MNKKNINLFIGGLDLDSDALNIEKGDYIYALNILNGNNKSNTAGAVSNSTGMTSVVNTFLIGRGDENSCIGTYEDLKENTLIFFIWNKDGYHGIYRYYRDVVNNTIGEIQKLIRIEYPYLYTDENPNPLGFEKDKLITGITLTDNLLFWANPATGRRFINIDKANETFKKRKFNLYFHKENFGVQRDYRIRLYAFTNPVPVNTFIFSTSASTYQQTCAEFTEAFSLVPQTPGQYTVTNRGSFVEIEMVNYGKYFIDIDESTDSFVTTVRRSVIVPDNFYPEKDLALENAGVINYPLFNMNLIDAIRAPSFCAPLCEYKTDPLAEANLVRDKYFQFRTVYVYEYYERTTYGTISNIAMPTSTASVDIGIAENYIQIDFNDDKLINPGKLSDIRNVIISFSDDNRATWKNLKALEAYEFAGGQKFDFYNNGTFSVADPAEVVLPYSAEPVKTGALEIVDDRQFLGDVTEGYDKPDIVASASQEFEVNPAQQRYSIRGRIYIKDHYTNDYPQSAQYIYRKHYDTPGNPQNPTTNVFGGMYNSGSQFVVSDPTVVTQVMPNAGWSVYLSGTDYMAVTKQVIDPAYDPANFPTSNGNDIRTLIGPDGVFDIFNDFQASDILLAAGGESSQLARLVYSEFEIKNVPAGSYILRVSSHAVPSTDITPAFYNNRAYQRTSTNIGATGVGASGSTEIGIVVGGSDVTISDTEVYNMVGIGFFLTSLPEVYQVQQCYLRGNDIVGSTNVDIWNDVAIPRATAKYSTEGGGSVIATITTGASTVIVSKTDHNGYFYCYNLSEDNSSVNQDTKTTHATSGFYQDALADSDKYFYETGLVIPSNGTHQVFYARVDSADIKAYSRTFIQGRFSGQQLDNVSVIPKGQSPGITDNDGTFSVLVYAETYDPPASTLLTTYIYFAASDANTILSLPIPQGPFLLQFTIAADGVSTFNEATPFVFPNAFTNIIIVGAISVSVWKPGSETLFGIVYADDYDRNCAVCTTESLKIKIPYLQPAATQQGETTISLSLEHEPPVWAKKYYIVRTEDLVQSQFFQWVANSVEYVQNDFTTPTAYSNADAAYLKINLANLDYYHNTQYPNSYLPSENWNTGDIIRIITNNANVPYAQVYEYQIVKGTSATNTDLFIYKDPAVDFSGAPGFGMFIEIYRPRNQGQTNFYYECECFPVGVGVFNGVRKRYHVGNIQNQSYGTLPLNTVTPAIVKLSRGNSYTRLRNMSVNTPPATGPVQYNVQKVYDESISDFYSSRSQSLGRINSDSIDIGQTYSPSAEKFTDRYISNTKINGFCKIQPLNRKQFSTDYGAIRKLQLYNDEILVAIFDNSVTVPQYINKNILREATGQSLVAISEDVIPSSNQMKRMAGTQNPESVVINENNNIFSLDVSVGVPWRDGGNGIIDIGKIKTAKFWANESSLRKYPGRAPAVFDIKHNLYMVTLGPLTPSAGERPECTFMLPYFDAAFPYGATQIVMTGVIYPNNTPLFSISRNDAQFPNTALMVVNSVNGLDTLYEAVVNSNGSVTVYAPMNSALYGNNTLTISLQYILDGVDIIKHYDYSFTQGRDPDVVSSEYVPKTIAFNPKTYDNDSISRNRWFSFYEFVPEYYGRVAESIMGFKDGNLWLFDDAAAKNNFFGLQKSSTITHAVNDDFNKVKNYRSYAHKATTKWHIPVDGAVVPPNQQYPQGMKSEMPPHIIIEEEGKYYGAFLQDSLTPNATSYTDALLNGRDLLGNVLIVTLKSDETQETLLYFSEVIYFESEYS